MEIKYTICRSCKELKTRIFYGTFGNGKNKRWKNENNKLWSGKYCPDCNNNRVKIRKRTKPPEAYVSIKKLEETKSLNEILDIKERRRERNRRYVVNRLKKDINFRLAHNLRSRLYNAIKRNQKIGSAVDDLGCSIDELKIHLASKFEPGMTWENYGEWEIDHKISLSSVNLSIREEFLKVNNYNNLQPMWKLLNIKKGKK